MTAVHVTVFADFGCAFCRVAETMLRGLPAGELAITYRAFERYPDDVPLPAPDPLPPELEHVARELGLRWSPPDRLPRTGKAHELAHLARGQGPEGALRDALYHALWVEGEDIGRVDVLTRIGAGCGLDAGLVKVTLDVDRFGDQVRHDRLAAERLGIDAVPATIVGTGAHARLLLGVHPAETLLDEIRAARGRN